MTRILANGLLLMTVHNEDAVLEAADRQLVARAYAQRIADAITAYRRDREPAVVSRRVGLAVTATVALFAAGFVLRRIGRRIRVRLEKRFRSRTRDVAIQTFRVVTTEQMWAILLWLLRVAGGIAFLAMLYFYLRYTLGLFPWTRGLSRRLFEIAIDPLRNMGLGLITMFPNLVFLAALFLITRAVNRLVRLFFENVAAGRVTLREFDADWAMPTFKLVRLLIVALALVVAYPYIPGSNSDAFKGISLFVGVMFSIGSSSFIANLIAGYSITYQRSFKVGDRVKVGDHSGEVISSRLLATHLRTPKNEEIVVPNSKIVASEVVNFTSMARDRGLILHTTVGIGYETPWRQVEAMLIEAARRTPGLWPDPPPFVLQLGLGDFCVTYEINVYCDAPERMRLIYADLHRHILDVFNEYGVQIMTPAYEGDPKEPKVVPKEQWFASPAKPPTGAAGVT